MDDHNNNNSYQLRCLTDDDITEWSHFCANCFSYKPNPPPASYFQRHFYNDPQRDSSLIKVIIFNDDDDCNNNSHDDVVESNKIVSSVRIFQRRISIGNNNNSGKFIKAGGIGEVCTSEQHRKRGLAKRLLVDAMNTMSNERKMQCSLLHASSALTSVYEKSGGYKCVTTKWSVLKVNMESLNLQSSSNHHFDSMLHVRLASFPNDTERLCSIHKKYSEDRFAGCIIRSIEYWNNYLRFEIGESLFVLTDDNSSSNNETNGTKSVLGWISIRPRNGKIQLRDFGLDLDLLQSLGYTTSQIFSRLLAVALSKEKHNIIHTNDSAKLDLLIPTVIVEEMSQQKDFCKEKCTWVDWSVPFRDENDIGWMYKMFNDTDDQQHHDNNIIHLVNNNNVPHLIWPSDSF